MCGSEHGLAYDVFDSDTSLRGRLVMCPDCRTAIGSGRFELTPEDDKEEE